MSRPDLDSWLERPAVRIQHRRETDVPAGELWAAACSVRLSDTRALGRLVRMRIPGLPAELSFDQMFRSPPFNVLEESEHALLSGLVGRIWTLRRDYPILRDPAEFRAWSARGTVRVLFANWVEPAPERAVEPAVEPAPERGAILVSETRVSAVDRRGRIGLAAVRPLIASSHQLISREAINAAVRAAYAKPGSPSASRRRSRGATR